MRDEDRLLLEEVDAIRARLDAHRPYTPDVAERLKRWFTPRFLYCSSALGVQQPISPIEVAAFVEREVVGGGHPLEAFLSLQRHARTLELVADQARAGGGVSLAFVQQLHRSLTAGAKGEAHHRPGCWKIKPSTPTRRRGHEIEHADPSEVEALMVQLTEGLAEQLDASPVIAATWFYFHFNRIQPFQTQNGKVARLLATYLLTSHGYPPLLIRPDELGSYLDAIVACEQTVPADERGFFSPKLDLSPLLGFVARCLLRTGEHMHTIVSGQRIGADEFEDRVAEAQDQLMTKLTKRGSSAWRVRANDQIKQLYERVDRRLRMFEVAGSVYHIRLLKSHLVPSHAVSAQLRVGLPRGDAGLVGELALEIHGDELLAHAVTLPEPMILHVGVTATSIGLQLALCWEKSEPSLHHGPPNANEWPESTIDDLLSASVDLRRQKFEGSVRERNASGSQRLKALRQSGSVKTLQDPSPSEEVEAPLPATASRRTQEQQSTLDGLAPSEPPVSF